MSMYFDLGREYTKLETELIEENSRLKEELKKSQFYNKKYYLEKIDKQAEQLRNVKAYYNENVKPSIVSLIQKPLTMTIETKMKLEDIVRHFLHKFEFNIMVDVVQIDDNSIGFLGASITDQIIWDIITTD